MAGFHLKPATSEDTQFIFDLRLLTMKETPAQKIYERHGFVVVNSNTHNLEMVKEPSNE